MTIHRFTFRQTHGKIKTWQVKHFDTLEYPLHIDYLKNHSHHLPTLAKWAYDTWGKYNSNPSIERSIAKLTTHLNEDELPICYIAYYVTPDKKTHPIGMVSLRATDGYESAITPCLLCPWLCSLYVDPKFRGQKVGERLIETALNKARDLGHRSIYLLAFDKTIFNWYAKLGWVLIGRDDFDGHPIDIMEYTLIPA